MIVDDFCLPPKKGPAIPTSPRRGLFFVPRILSQLQPRPPQGGVFFRVSENGRRRLSRSTLPGSPAPRLSGGPEDVKPRNFAGRNERPGVTPPQLVQRVGIACRVFKPAGVAGLLSARQGKHGSLWPIRADAWLRLAAFS